MRKIMRIAGVKGATGHKSNSTVYLKISEGLITKPVKIGPRASGWPEDEIAEINSARIAGKSAEEIRALVKRLEAERVGQAT